MNRINQDAEISQQVSLWDQRGSQAIFGTLLVIPIGESLIYVAPLYLRSDGGRIPELKRIIAVYDNNIAMEPTLDAALASIFQREEDSDAGSAAGGAQTAAVGIPQSPSESTEHEDMRLEARRLFDLATQARRDGNWTEYGASIDALGAALESLAAQAQRESRVDETLTETTDPTDPTGPQTTESTEPTESQD